MKKNKKIGIVLSGGGARGAYQAGVIKALCEICVEKNIENPFKVITGISAGAINASYLASACDDLKTVGKNLPYLWENIQTDQIFKMSPFTMGRVGVQLIKQLSTGAITRQTPVKGLLDTSPLHELLSKYLKPEDIEKNLDEGRVESLAVTATNYKNSQSVTFVQTKKEFAGWEKLRRKSVIGNIGVDEVMASSAIPVLFPPYQVGETFYGDGGVRNSMPISPALRLGVDKLVVVGVNCNEQAFEFKMAQKESGAPNLAKILGVLINGILMDGVDTDMERLKRVNKIVDSVSGLQGADLSKDDNPTGYRKVESLWLSPSQYLGAIASKWMDTAPKMLKYLVGGLGGPSDSTDLMSYLLFESEYCSELVHLGYNDAMEKKKKFLDLIE